MEQPYYNFRNEPVAPPYVVVNQQPPHPNRFPISFNLKIVFVFGILKCIIGFLEFLFGVVNIFFLYYFTSVIAFPIWCGLVIFTNGLLGVILKCRQTKCLIASFYALSITSLILTVIMLSIYSVTLSYYVSGGGQICDYYYPYWRVVCHNFLSASAQSSGIGMTAALVTLIIFELACSIVSVVVSCRAYSKFCSTCDCSDCCTCFGCCECSCVPFNMQQNEGQYYGSSIHNNGFPLRSPHEQYQESHPAHLPCNSQRPDAYSINTRHTHPMSGYSNPCSALVNIFIQVPGASHLISSSNGDRNQAGAQNITIQSRSGNEQEGDTQHAQHHDDASEVYKFVSSHHIR